MSIEREYFTVYVCVHVPMYIVAVVILARRSVSSSSPKLSSRAFAMQSSAWPVFCRSRASQHARSGIHGHRAYQPLEEVFVRYVELARSLLMPRCRFSLERRPGEPCWEVSHCMQCWKWGMVSGMF